MLIQLDWKDARKELPKLADPERVVSVHVKMYVLDYKGVPYIVEGFYDHEDKQWFEENNYLDCITEWETRRVLNWAYCPLITFSTPE